MVNRLHRWERLWVVAVLVWGVIFYAQTDWPQFPAVYITFDKLPAVMAAEAAQTRRVLFNRFGYWLLTSAGLYALGHGFAWSRRGFSSDINHLR
jgi:hypothetical protein